jgi:integrase
MTGERNRTKKRDQRNRKVAPGIYKTPYGKFMAVYRVDGRQHSTSCETFEDAQDLRAEKWLQRRSPAADLRPRQIFIDWAEGWLARKMNLRPATRAKYTSIIRNQLETSFGTFLLEDIEQEDVQAFVSGASERWSARSVREYYSLLAQIMKAAARRKLIDETPCFGIELPRIDSAERRYLTPAQVHTLVAAIPEEHRALILCAAYTGARWEELAALRRSRVELEVLPPRIRLYAVIERDGGRLRYTENMKSGNSRRIVSLPATVAQALKVHLHGDPTLEYAFSNRSGGFLNYGNFRRRVWGPAVKSSGLAPLTFHELRHTAAALMIDTGTDPYLVMRRLGHEDISTTYNLYGHRFPSKDGQVAEDLDRLAIQAAQIDEHQPGDAVPLRAVGEGERS